MTLFTRISQVAVSLLCVVTMLGCEPYPNERQMNYTSLLNYKVRRYHPQEEQDLRPAFIEAGVPFPPKEIALLVFKEERKMELYAKHRGNWEYVMEYPIYGASGGPGPKLRSGDRQVPEGIYHVTVLNPRSKYDLSIKIDYPNDFDRRYAKIEHRNHLGNNIFIHGGDISTGCIAIGDRAIEDLFVLAHDVGLTNIMVVIAPNDLRVKPALPPKEPHFWIDVLDRRLAKTLQSFPRVS